MNLVLARLARIHLGSYLVLSKICLIKWIQICEWKREKSMPDIKWVLPKQNPETIPRISGFLLLVLSLFNLFSLHGIFRIHYKIFRWLANSTNLLRTLSSFPSDFSNNTSKISPQQLLSHPNSGSSLKCYLRWLK